MQRYKSQVLEEKLQLLGDEALLTRNKIHDVKKDTEVFKDESGKVRINQLNVKSNVKLNAKSNDSTKISKLQKLSDDAKQYEDKAKKIH